MFGSLGNKIVSGIASLTALVFSSYQGNEAQLSDIGLLRQGNQLTVACRLQHAFDHDFEEFFRSGKPINVWFIMQIRSNGRVVRERLFYHRVQYAPMRAYFNVNLQDQQFTTSVQNYQRLLELLCGFTNTFVIDDLDQRHPIEISITAYLSEIRLDTMEKPFDMMLLWNFKRPDIKVRTVLNDLET